MPVVSEERIQKVEWAFAEMQKRGWGFSSNGSGFGDPRATFTAIGVLDDGFLEVIAADPDAVKAVEKAISISGSSDPSAKGF